MELLKKLKVSRRLALRGVLGGVGVAMWLPVLDAMCNNNGEAFAAGDPLPTSFGIWFWGNGIHTDVWTPKATGSGDAWQLSTNLQDFKDLKDSMTLVTGLDMMDAQFKGHGWGVAYVLAGGDGTICNLTSDLASKVPSNHHFETSDATQYVETVDQTIAKYLDDQAQAKHKADPSFTPPPWPSFETGMIPFSGDVAMGTPGSNLAHKGPNNFLPPKREPKDIFNALFSADQPTMPPPTGSGGAGGSSGNSNGNGVPSDISFKMRRSVLDAVLEDAKRLKMTLGADDAKRLDSHMDGIRSIEQRIPATTSTAAGGTGPNTGAGGSTGTTPVTTCKYPDAPPMTFADMTAKSQVINRLIVSALACNMTRVYTHLWSGPRSDSTYPILKLNGAHHAYTHGTDGQEPRTIERYIMSQYADLATVMKATPMGAGNVLDNTIIYGVSEVAEPHNHIMTNYHIVLMGHAGGKIPGNRHIRLPGRKVTELVLTLQQVMGLNKTSWGSWDQTSKVMSEILA